MDYTARVPVSLRPGAIDATQRNVLLLGQLRWLAVAGQLATILIVHFPLGVALPLAPMLAALAVLVALNVAVAASRGRWPVSDAALFATLLVDVACLTVQLYVSGGVGNPFVALYLLQVVLAAVLLPSWASWALVALTSGLFAALAVKAPPFSLPAGYASKLSVPYVTGSWISFTLTAVLLVLFVTQIVRNLSERDARLAALRQRAAEEEHVVRMGLLASGAAHELGTPLASIAVMLGDWSREPAITRSPALQMDLDDMRAEVMRCKSILGNILLASGEVRGESPTRTTLATFLDGIIADWREKTGLLVVLTNRLEGDPPIVGDRALAQTITNLLDNAAEAGATRIAVQTSVEGDLLALAVRDNGTGFAPAILEHVGKPYQSTKERRGAGLGLFLATNVLRQLGGTLAARNLDSGGSEVRLLLPLEALSIASAA